jgi:hypothetical protein
MSYASSLVYFFSSSLSYLGASALLSTLSKLFLTGESIPLFSSATLVSA